MTRIHNDFASAEISPLGAELVRLQDAQGRDWLWDANPAWWKGHSPLLFPIVGNVRDDRIVVDGREYPMKRHGLARISTFEPAESAPSRCAYVLKSSDATRAQYPFDFELRVTYALEGSTLAITAVVTNAGEAPMPASFGFHPAMTWPFPGDDVKTGHVLAFDEIEDAPIRRLRYGLLLDESFASPVEGERLRLDDSLFAADAVIFDVLKSRGLNFVAPSGRFVRFTFPDMPNLGVWSKPGARFLCIEPWSGYADAEGFAGEFAAKPGLVSIAPGASATFGMSIELPR
jgi:galactose mutarotase-like enzyme